MPVKLAYNTLEWGPTPDLHAMLSDIKEAGWDGWEVRQPLDWLGSAERINDVVEETGVPVAAVCGQGWGFADDRVAIESNKRRIEFAAAPPEAGTSYGRLYGTVRDRSGRTFNGFVTWHTSFFQSHDLHGFDSNRYDRGMAFSRIQVIEKNRGGARVTLESGEIVEFQRMWLSRPGVRVADPALGTVRLEWDAFSSLHLEDPLPGLGYDSFDGGHPLFGTVVTRQGDEITGRIRWDADEEWSWELLNGRSDDVDFQIEFGNIEHIEANEDGGARVTLLDGRSFELDGSNDVSADNKGIFVFPPSDEIPEAERDSERPAWRYISWEDFREVRFRHPVPPGAAS